MHSRVERPGLGSGKVPLWAVLAVALGALFLVSAALTQAAMVRPSAAGAPRANAGTGPGARGVSASAVAPSEICTADQPCPPGLWEADGGHLIARFWRCSGFQLQN